MSSLYSLTFDNSCLSQPRHAPPTLLNKRSAINCTDRQRQAISIYLEAATSTATKRAYQNDLTHFERWGGVIPATPDMVAAYLAEHAGLLSVATLTRRLSAISHAHRSSGHSTPTTAPLVSNVMQGIRRRHCAQAREATPILAADLHRILPPLSQDLRDLRDRAILLLGFAGGFRRSEIVGLNLADLTVKTASVSVLLKRSKTDQTGQGRSVSIPEGRSETCPVAAVKEWLACSGIHSGPVFRPIDRHGNTGINRLTGHAVSEIIKKRVLAAGGDPTVHSAHSLRAGYVTSAALAGHSPYEIRKQTGHRSLEMVARYVRISDDALTRRRRSLL